VFDLWFRVGDESLDEIFDAFEDVLVVDDDALGLVACEIPHDSQR